MEFADVARNRYSCKKYSDRQVDEAALTAILEAGRVAPEVIFLCLLLLSLNPISSYMGYYGSVTGDIGIFGTFCSHLGIDTSDKWFIFLFYKVSSLVCILIGVLFLALSIWYMEKRRRT